MVPILADSNFLERQDNILLSDMLEEYRIMNWRLLLGDADHFDSASDLDRDYVLRKAVKFIGRVDDTTHQRHYNARLLLAAHLCPDSALNYDETSTEPRHRLIVDYLTEEFGFQEEQVLELSKSIQRLLESWESSRKQVSSHSDKLRKRQNHKCAHCNVLMTESPITLQERDTYKPYYENPDMNLSPEVDHIIPVSTFGTNNLANLQVLCRLCNQGKGNGLGVRPGKELKHSGDDPNSIPWHHRASMLYYVILRDGNICQSCGEPDKELTIRPDRDDGGYIQSNLRTLCIDCAEFHTQE